MMIYAQNLHYSYDGKQFILKNLSMRIHDGESVAILGKNGAGKTTLIKTLNGLLIPQKGEVFMDGVSTKSASVAELSKKVGIAFQNPDHALFSETVRDEILFSLNNWNFPSRDVEDKFETTVKLFELQHFLEKSPFNLSGGERKLVSIATIFCWSPKHLILDEPTIGQDSNHRRLLTKILKNHLAAGNTVIIITQDVDWAITTFSRVIILKEGQILADGPPERIFSTSRIIEESSLLPPQIITFSNACRKLWSDFPPHVIHEEKIQNLILERLQ